MDDTGNRWTDASAMQQVQNGDPHSAESAAAWDHIEARVLMPEEQVAAILDVIGQPLFLSEDELPQYGKPGPYCCSRCLGPRGTRRGTLCAYCALEQEQKPGREPTPAGNLMRRVRQVIGQPLFLIAFVIAFICMVLDGLILAGIVPVPG